MDLVNYQYSGNEHEVIAGVGLVNVLWYGCKQEPSIPVDYRIYDKDTDGKTKTPIFATGFHSQKSVELSHLLW